MWKGSVIVGCSTAAACIMVFSVFCELRPLGGQEGTIESHMGGIVSFL